MKHSRTPHPTQHGFTLVEIAIVLVVIGLLASGGIALFALMAETSREKLTRERMGLIVQALTAQFAADYANDTNRSPTDLYMVCPSNPASPGSESTAHCGQRGVISWVDLGLPPEVSFDGWGRRFTYQVITAPGSLQILEYSAANGAPSPPSPTAPTPEFILVSHGQNGGGAFLESGAILDAGSPSVAEGQNADGDTAYAVAPRSDNPDARFDDLVVWRTRNQLVVGGGALIPAATTSPNTPPGGSTPPDGNDGGGNDTPPSQGGNNGGGSGNEQCPDGSTIPPCGSHNGGNNGGN